MKLRCLIIDDEPLARQGLLEYIDDIDFLESAGEFDHPLKAVAAINSGSIQLLLIDIEMPKITGLEFIKSIRQPPPVIVTTAYPQYALEGFELNALDYLVKPISFERFLKAALKAREYYEVRQQNLREDAGNKSQDYFFVKADNKLVRIDFADILFVEALQNYVMIQTRERKYITYLTFKSVEEYLPGSDFLKTHKSFIVSCSKIDSIEGNGLRIGEKHIPISRNEKEKVMEKLMNGKFLKR